MRHRFHAICPYFAMFPETFVAKHLVFSKPGDTILDPFSGRGTTPFESLLNGRRALALDINPVAVCVSRAKTNAPSPEAVFRRIDELEAAFEPVTADVAQEEFFKMCFDPETLEQILFMRRELMWTTDNVDCFIAALCLGRLHGESHKSPSYFSNRMPRTISTKPAYSVRWWKAGGYLPPKRNVFSILRTEAAYRFVTPAPDLSAEIAYGDVRQAASLLDRHHDSASLIITSPPYLDTTNFEEDQWLRRWFLGGPPSPAMGRTDHRHWTASSYWKFLEEAWEGVAPLIKAKARLVIRIGGSKLSFDDATDGLATTLAKSLPHQVRLLERHSSEIVGGQIRSFHPKARGEKREFDFVYALKS